MDNREAIEMLNDWSMGIVTGISDKCLQAAIVGLEELEKYKATHLLPDEIVAMEKEFSEYYQIGTAEQVREAVERMKPKKPIIIDKQFLGDEVVEMEWKCPVCGLNVIEEPPCQNYCQRCGNNLDWSAEE